MSRRLPDQQDAIARPTFGDRVGSWYVPAFLAESTTVDARLQRRDRLRSIERARLQPDRSAACSEQEFIKYVFHQQTDSTTLAFGRAH